MFANIKHNNSLDNFQPKQPVRVKNTLDEEINLMRIHKSLNAVNDAREKKQVEIYDQPSYASH